MRQTFECTADRACLKKKYIIWDTAGVYFYVKIRLEWTPEEWFLFLKNIQKSLCMATGQIFTVTKPFLH